MPSLSNNQPAPDSYAALTAQQGRPGASQEFNAKEFLFRYLYLLPWILVSVGISLSIAYTRLRYINPVYSASGKVLIKTDKPVGAGGGGDKLGDMITTTVNARLMDDQIELIRSTAMARLVVRYANLQQSYYYKGELMNRLIHNPASPIRLNIVSLKDSSSWLSLMVNAVDDNHFTLNGGTQQYAFGVPFETGQGSFILEKRINQFSTAREFICNWAPEEPLARGLAGGINVAVTVKGGNVLNFVYYSEHPKVAEDVVKGFLRAYQEYSLQDKREGAISALAFIDEQLLQAKQDLTSVELRMQQFKEQNKVVALESQAAAYYTQLNEKDQEIDAEAIRLKMLDFLIGYIKDPKNTGRSIPQTPGLEATSVSSMIADYNKSQLQREILVQTVPKDNPIVRDLDMSLVKIKNEILLSLAQVRDGYQSRVKNLRDAELSANTVLRSMPEKQKQLLEIAREQKVMEELYSSLFQRKIQTSIGSASTLSNIQVLENGYSGGWPVSPIPKSFYTTALLIGLAIPIGIALLLELLNDKVNSKQDIERITSTPYMGEVGHAEKSNQLVVSSSSRNFVAEQFRIIRSNLQFVLPKEGQQTILVSSSMGGEGKTFMSINLAAVMAVAGKKTVVLEFDIRKPKVLKGVGLDRKSHKGITNYLLGKAEIDDIILPVSELDNLYTIGCGPIPPNPAELLLDSRMQDFFAEVKKRFDVVVIDTAPIGLVSDAIVLGAYADATVYVVRHNFTFKKQVQLVEEMYANKKLPHLSLVINDVKARWGYGRYYAYGNYGYVGYGYRSKRYASDYFDS